MFKKIGKLLISKISNSSLYAFSIRLITLISEVFGENTVIAPYLTAIQKAADNLEWAFMRNMASLYTEHIREKHLERRDYLTALRRAISTAQKLRATPDVVTAANAFKQEMKSCGFWVWYKISFMEATAIIYPLLRKMAQAPFAQWGEAVGVSTILSELQRSQEEFEVLFNNRIDERSSDMTPTQVEGRTELLESIFELFAVVNFGAKSDPEMFAAPAKQIRELVSRTNAITRAGQTRAENGKEEANEDIEVESVIESETEPGSETKTEENGFSGDTAYA